MNWFAFLPLIIQLIPTIQSIWNVTTSNASTIDKLKGVLTPELIKVIEDEAAVLFPKAAPTIHLLAGAIAAFNPDYTKWLQGSLNVLLPFFGLANPNLLVDGVYGKHTRDAVEAVQKHFGITIDGVAGNITQGWIAKALAALPQVA